MARHGPRPLIRVTLINCATALAGYLTRYGDPSTMGRPRRIGPETGRGVNAGVGIRNYYVLLGRLSATDPASLDS